MLPRNPVQPEPQATAVAAMTAAAITLALALAGCQGTDRGEGGGGSTARSVAATRNVADQSPDAGTQTHVPGEAWRLPQDVHRTARTLQWGVVKYQVEPAQPRYQPRSWRGVVRLRALTPDGRVATVSAEPGGDGRVQVHVHVGLFGDTDDEARFVRSLRDTLAGEAKPVRGWGFELPDAERADEQTE